MYGRQSFSALLQKFWQIEKRGGGLVEMRGRATKEGNLEGMVTRLRWLADWDEQAGHHERLSRRDGGPFPLVGWLG